MDDDYARRIAESLETIAKQLREITEDIHWIEQVLEDRL